MIDDLLKGVHKMTKRLASGVKVEYHYSWRSGPRIKSKPGTQEYFREHLRNLDGRNAAPTPVVRDTGPKKDIAWLIDGFQESPDFKKLKPPTQRDYKAHMKAISDRFGRVQVSTFEKTGVRARIGDWHHETAAQTGDRHADYRLAVLRRVLSWGVQREVMDRNPATGIDNLHKVSRAEKIWTGEQLEAFSASAPEHMVRALWFAVLTGQRQKDLLAAQWKQVRNGAISFTQSKTGALARVELTDERLQKILECPGEPDEFILLGERGKPWKTGFASNFKKHALGAGITDRTFHDLRGTFITDQYIRGSSFRKISEASGHSEKSVEGIIRKHYLANNLTLRSEHSV